MQDIHTMLSTLRRPRILVSAARHGIEDYCRTRNLRRILGDARLPSSGEAALRLMEIEAFHDEARRTGDGSYSIARHIEVLIALMAEAQLLRQPVLVE
ncbi:MAG: DUF6477 family protein [Pseudomonadota bacterium]